MNFSQLVDRPTHVRGNLLDLVLSNVEEIISHVRVGEPPVVTDHKLISFDIVFTVNKSGGRNSTVKFDYMKADWFGLNEFLLASDFSVCYESSDVNFIWSSLKAILVSSMDMFIPKVKLRSKQFPVWYTPELWHRNKCLQTLRKSLNKQKNV